MLDMSGLTGLPEPEVATKDTLDIPLSDIAPDPDQPRKEFDAGLIETISAQLSDPNIGQIEPIFARANIGGNPAYLIVHGETRYRAAVVAGLKTIRAIITTEGSFIRQLLSNETRGDLSIYDRARAYRSLKDNHGCTQDYLVQMLGKDSAHISMHLNLLTADPIVEIAYREGKAESIRVLDDLRKLVDNKPKSLSAIEKFISESESITRVQVAELSKTLSKRKAKPKAPAKVAPMIDGKAFDVVSVDDGVLTIKLKGKGVKVEKQYRLVPVEQPENT